jgi:hypothetical protein
MVRRMQRDLPWGGFSAALLRSSARSRWWCAACATGSLTSPIASERETFPLIWVKLPRVSVLRFALKGPFPKRMLKSLSGSRIIVCRHDGHRVQLGD